jgi:uncharacterized protein (DUF58 family)
VDRHAGVRQIPGGKLFIQKRTYLVIALVIVTIISGLATGFGLFYRLIYILLLTTVLSFIWNWVSMLGLDISVDRRTKRARVGDDIEERITIRNHIPLPKPTLEVEDVTDIPGYSSGQALSLSSRGFRSWRTISPARKRGVYTLGPVRVSNSDAFGLFRRDADFGESDSLVVYPRTYNLSHFEIPATYLTGESNARRRSHDLTPHAASVREYAFGDSLSRIHWNSTARTQRLMSKEFDLGLSSDVWLMVDLHAEVQAGELEDSTDEYAVSIAASLARRYQLAHLPVGLIEYGDARYLLPADTGAGQYERIMEYLARSKAEGTTSLSDALAQEEQLWGTHSSLIVITSSHRDDWPVAIRELVRRRVRVAVILIDGKSFGGMFETLNTVPALYDAGVSPFVVRLHDDIPTALSRPFTIESRSPENSEAVA